jgi:hypothetical protein
MKPLWALLPFLVGAAPAAAISMPSEQELLEEAASEADEDERPDGEDEKPSGHVPACVGGQCPATLVETVLYSYGTACSGLDWRFLKQVAVAESGLDPRNRTGKYVGLFQMAKDGCKDNLGAFKGFLSCDDLEDPEVNTAVAADRFDRYFRGRGDYPGIVKACPGNSPQQNMALAYVGHNNGPAVLKYALVRKACTDAEIRKAIAAFYANHKGARTDGKYVNADGALVDCNPKYEQKYQIKGTPSWRCVNAKWGIAKYEYGKRRVSTVKGVERLYDPAVKGRTLECPSVAGKRLFSKPEILASLKDGTFRDKPIADPELIARLEKRRRKAAEEGGRAYAKAERAVQGWSADGDGLIQIAGSRKGKYKPGQGGADQPGVQLPARLVLASAPPPEPERRWASDARDDELEKARSSVVAQSGAPKKSGGSLWAAIKSFFGF